MGVKGRCANRIEEHDAESPPKKKFLTSLCPSAEKTNRRTLLKRLAGSAIAATFPVESRGELRQSPEAGGVQEAGGAQKKYLALPLAKSPGKATALRTLDRWGIPFVEGKLDVPSGGTASLDLGGMVRRIFLLGMTESDSVRAWADPRDYSVRFFIGDQLGQIRLDYAGGETQIFPLILGESIWWGSSFFRNPGPFPTDAVLRRNLAAALRLYPPTPMRDGDYVAVITPRPRLLRSLTIEISPEKKGTVTVAGITVEPIGDTGFARTIVLPPGNPSPQFDDFLSAKSLRPAGEGEHEAQRRLNDLSRALYSSNEVYRDHVTRETPDGYSGPDISFQGDTFTGILANVFRYNLQDIHDKIDADGTYHTSTKGALVWGGDGAQYGTFRTGAGLYYADSWSRDMGRSLEELTVLGGVKQGIPCADFCFRMARLWEQQSSLMIDNQFFPPHWGRVANKPKVSTSFENDGHGLIILFLYKLWQRLRVRDEWLRSHWVDVQAAGNWILWQFEHPEISGAANGLLHTTGESAGGNGYSVYADAICMHGLRGLAEMADSIGEGDVAKRWRERAEKMREAIATQYVVSDPKYGRVWTLKDAGWPDRSTVLGPLIFLADYLGFAPEDDGPQWRAVNEATYQRLIDTYRPFGFYGQAMGYGQGFVTQAALLLDRMRDATEMLRWTAKQIYDPRFGSYVVPEGVQIDPTGRYWYRAGDLGNGVQEAEIVKALRLLVGVDDTQPSRLRLFPRMPYDWNEIGVRKYPVLFTSRGMMETTFVHYKLERSKDGMKLEISSDKELGPAAVRLGPFEKSPGASGVRVNGQNPAAASIEHSGDSWWVRFTVPVPLAGVSP